MKALLIWYTLVVWLAALGVLRAVGEELPYGAIKEKCTLILWGKVAEAKTRPLADQALEVNFTLTDLSVLLGKFAGSRLSLRIPPGPTVEMWPRFLASRLEPDVYGLFLLKEAENGAPTFALPEDFSSCLFLPMPGSPRKFASLDDLLARLERSHDTFKALAAISIMGDPLGNAAERSDYFSAVRRLSRENFPESAFARRAVEDLDDRLRDEEYGRSLAKQATGVNQLKVALMRYLAAWNAKDWPALKRLHAGALATKAPVSWPTNREELGEMISYELQDAVFQENGATAKVTFQYDSKTPPRTAKLGFTRDGVEWLISSEARQ